MVGGGVGGRVGVVGGVSGVGDVLGGIGIQVLQFDGAGRSDHSVAVCIHPVASPVIVSRLQYPLLSVPRLTHWHANIQSQESILPTHCTFLSLNVHCFDLHGPRDVFDVTATDTLSVSPQTLDPETRTPAVNFSFVNNAPAAHSAAPETSTPTLVETECV